MYRGKLGASLLTMIYFIGNKDSMCIVYTVFDQSVAIVKVKANKRLA